MTAAIPFTPSWRRLALSAGLVLALGMTSQAADPRLRVGFGEADITPELSEERPVWLAGYGPGRAATGVHDPLLVRCVALEDGGKRFALVSVDLVGLQLPETRRIREGLPDFDYVMVSSTHNHEAPDVIGIWGKTPLQRGVDDAYLDLVVARSIEAVKQAQQRLAPARAYFGAAEDETLLGDSRQPIVKDGVLRVLRFVRPDDSLMGLLVQWNCHPEALGSRNTLITADFPYATVAALKENYHCPVAYFTGAVGGLMAPPRGRIFNAQGDELRDGQFEYAESYGRAVAGLAENAIRSAEPIRLTPLAVSARAMVVPLENSAYRAARSIGVLRREAKVYKGDPADTSGEAVVGDTGQPLGFVTEVACLELGELRIACIPGEIYPEIVYGKYQEPVEPNVDFPEAPLEPSVAATIGSSRWMLFGLANDEIGYIIPKRQWDQAPPFAYGREKSQYGEINSCGPDVAPALMQMFVECVKGLDANRQSQGR